MTYLTNEIELIELDIAIIRKQIELREEKLILPVLPYRNISEFATYDKYFEYKMQIDDREWNLNFIKFAKQKYEVLIKKRNKLLKK